MTALVDDMAFAGKKLDNDDLMGYILAGLESHFDPIIAVVPPRVDTISISELYGQLVYHEQRKKLHGKEYSMANTATRGRGGPPGHGGFGHGGGPAQDRGRGKNTYSGGDYNQQSKLECQLCGRKGDTIQRC
jgi:hypothetical protein